MQVCRSKRMWRSIRGGDSESLEYDPNAIRVTVYPFNDSKSSIDIERSRPFGAKEGDPWPEARIDWPSIGSVNKEKAETFSAALIEAVRIAEEMNRPVRIGEATFIINGTGEVAKYACTRREQIEETIKEEAGELVGLWEWEMI